MSVTYNRYLPNISNIIIKNWNILQISTTLQKVFDKKPMITYKRNKNLGELTGGHTLQGGKVFKTHLQIIKDESKSCNTTNKSSLCCTQVFNTKTFESYQTKRTFNFFFNNFFSFKNFLQQHENTVKSNNKKNKYIN